MPREGSKLRESVGRIGSGKVSKKKKKIDRKTYGLTNRPEFQSKNLKSVEFKQREKHQNLPNDAGRLVIRNLDFKIKSIDLEDIFATFGKIIRFEKIYDLINYWDSELIFCKETDVLSEPPMSISKKSFKPKKLLNTIRCP